MSETPEEVIWKTLAALLLSSGLTLAFVDGALEGFAPSPVHILEVDDGERELLQENPETLVLGSSHARSFSDFGRRLGWDRLVIYAEEGGTFSAFRWVLEHRIRPVLEAGISTDAGRFDRLRRLVLVTTYWDTCPATDTGFESNLPARAWRSQDYFNDVLAHGFERKNANSLQSRFRGLLQGSTLVQSTGRRSHRAGFSTSPTDRGTSPPHARGRPSRGVRVLCRRPAQGLHLGQPSKAPDDFCLR